MAQKKTEREHSQTQFSSFSILDGVMVKIGDKFCPPKQISLPRNILHERPSALLDFEYDFSLEENVLAQAEEEKKTKDAVTAKEASAAATDDATVVLAAENGTESTDSSTEGPSEVPSIDSCEILKPMSLPVSPRNSAMPDKKSYNDFNLSEFEDNNATPFELVELQTINVFDELKSVLQPNQSGAANGPKATSNVITINNHENNGRPAESPRNQIDGTFSFLTGTNLLSRTITSQFSAGTSSNLPCEGPPTVSISHTITDETKHVTPNNTLINVDCTPRPSVPAANANSNLTSTNSKSLPSLVGGDAVETVIPSQAQDFAGFSTVSGSAGLVNSNPEEVVPTQRVTDIMKQYQFTRIPETFSAPHETTLSSPSTRPSFDAASLPYPYPRYGQLAPLNHTPIPSTFSGMPSVHFNATSNAVTVSRPTSRERSPQLEPLDHTYSSSFKANDFKKPQTPVIPPIQQQSCFRLGFQETDHTSVFGADRFSRPSHDSWLPDPTPQLASNERELVTTLTAMGFPAVRSARAVKRIGTDEKKVVEYLVHVQQVIDMGYNGDDVEVALEDSKTVDEAIKYLQVFRTLKELGFVESNIQDALKRTSGDQDAALEILMA